MRVGSEMRADAEESERLAAQAARRKRTLGDVARELMARGDTVVAGVPNRRFTGTVLHAAGDLVTLRTASGSVDINLRAPAYLRVVERAQSGGRGVQDGPSSFKARLFEVEMSTDVVEIGCVNLGEEQPGRVIAVGVDHVVWHDTEGGEWFLPLSAITHVAHRPLR